MEDSNHSSSNVSTSSSTIETASMKDEPGTPKHFTNLDSITSTSYSKSGSISGSSAVQDTFSNDSTSQAGTSVMADDRSAYLQAEEDQSGDMGIFHTKRKLHGKDKKICRVCGDKALGYNFNAMTCESCKAFFRRNALKESTPACMFQGNCNVDIRTRRFCPHCRLKKCFSMGMKKEMILDTEQRRARLLKVRADKLKVEARGQEKTIDELPVKPLEDSTKTLPLVYPSGSSTEGTFLWNQQSSLDTQQSSLQMSQSSLWTGQTFIGREQQTSSETQETSLGTEQTSSGSPLQSELEHSSDRQEMVKKRNLSKEDSETILTLDKFYTQAFTKGQETEVRPGANLEDLINTTKQTVQKFIGYVKHIEDFTNLDQKTQILLLKSRMMNSLVLRASYDYHKDNHSYNLVHTDKPVECDNLKEAFGAENIEYVEKLFQLNKSLQDKYGKDSKMYTILHLIVLFNPCVPDLKDCQFVSDLQIKYITLLKHYLESRFSYSESKTHFAFLLKKLNEVDSAAEGVMKVICGTLLTDVDPLMIEVLNL